MDSTSLDRMPGTLVILMILLLTGCGGGSAQNDDQGENTTGSNLASIKDDQEFASLLKQAIRNSTSTPYFRPSDEIQVLGGAAAALDVSQTNVQVRGVDEADLVKTDGRYMYIAVPATEAARLSPPSPLNRVRILQMQETPPTTTAITEITVGEEGDPPLQGIYLLKNDQGIAQTLVTISASNQGYGSVWFSGWYWQTGKSIVHIFDLSNPEQPQQQKRISIDGRLVASRRIGDFLYLVTRYSPYIEAYDYYSNDDAVVASNEQLLATASLSDLLPDIQHNDEASSDLLQASDCYLPAVDRPQVIGDLISLTVITIDQPDVVNSSCLLGGAETIYVSRQATYLATSNYPYVLDLMGRPFYEGVQQTQVHKFKFEGASTVYRGTATVAGHLGWEQDKKSFRMGEQGDYLGIVTSLGSTWDLTSTTHVNVLGETPAGDLWNFKQLATLPNEQRPAKIGKPGEKLYAARFVDNVSYLVTFRVTDPLYVIDLSDPLDPKIAGELSIDGYSDYLHPLPNNLLLGLGKDAEPDSSGDENRGAWYQGMKLSLFDVSDLNQPREIQSLLIGERGTTSAALYNHLAFTLLAADSETGRPHRLALPVQLHDIPRPGSTGEPWESYLWRQTGLYLFEIDDGLSGGTPAITRAGELITEARSEAVTYPTGSIYNDRSVITGNGIHYIHKQQVWSAYWEGVTPTTSGQ